MFDINMIQNLPVDDRKKLVNYVEGMPSQLNKQIKMILPEKYMDPSFFNSKTRKLHKYATIGKYLHRDDIIDEKYPQMVDYQRAYCVVMDWIYNRENNFPPKIQYKLETILNSECYNIDTLIQVEVFIGEFLKELEEDRIIMATPDILYRVGKGISWIVMDYKLEVYDFYTYLDMNQDIQLREEDFRHLSKINGIIWNLAAHGPGMSAFNDIGVLIYIYLKHLGLEKYIEKYNLFARFKCLMKHFGCTDDDIQGVYDRVMECETNKMSATAASSLIVNVDRLANMDKRKFAEFKPDITTANMNEENGFIFTFKNIKSFDPDMLGDISVKLRALNKEEILQYTDIDPENFTFDISANDVGHIRNECGINLGTIYSNFDKEMKYIIEHEGEFYLLFKNRMNTRIVYGISIEKYPSSENADRPRKIITIKESINFGYEYIPDL